MKKQTFRKAPRIVEEIQKRIQSSPTVRRVNREIFADENGEPVYRYYLDTYCSSRTLYNIRRDIINKFGNEAGTVKFEWAKYPAQDDFVDIFSYQGKYKGPAFDLYI